MSSADEAVSALADYTVVYDMKEENENILLGLDYILFAQTLAVLKSLSLDITHRIIRCPTGEVNRVVKGVTLYPYTRKNKTDRKNCRKCQEVYFGIVAVAKVLEKSGLWFVTVTKEHGLPKRQTMFR